MTKSDFVDAVAKESKLTRKEADAAVKAFTTVVTDVLKKGDKITFVGFGTFDVGERSARTGRNPQTGKEIKIKASKSPKFKAGKALKDAVNSGKKASSKTSKKTSK